MIFYLFAFNISCLCLLYLFTCSVSDVTFGITRDRTYTTTQETKVVEETTQGLSEWTPDYIA